LDEHEPKDLAEVESAQDLRKEQASLHMATSDRQERRIPQTAFLKSDKMASVQDLVVALEAVVSTVGYLC
jgi:hypothetical protein